MKPRHSNNGHHHHIPLDDLGVALRDWRKARDLSYIATGTIAELSPVTIANVENGRYIPRGRTLIKLTVLLQNNILI